MYFARQITLTQYKDESVQYTQQAVRALRGSPEYKQHVQRCKRWGECSLGGFDGDHQSGGESDLLSVECGNETV